MSQKEKKKGSLLGKLVLGLVVLVALAYGGWYGYAKATGDPVC